jgi:ankyrin repeat protein
VATPGPQKGNPLISPMTVNNAGGGGRHFFPEATLPPVPAGALGPRDEREAFLPAGNGLATEKFLKTMTQGKRETITKEQQIPDSIKSDFFLKVRNNRLQAVGQMLTEGVPPNVQDMFGNMPLHIACQTNNKSMVKLLLRWGAEINAQNKQGQTPLHFCFSFQFDQLGAYLIEKGALDTIKNFFGWTCYDGLRPDDSDEALFLLRQNLGNQAALDILDAPTDY